jgi:hypothetical protein
MLNAQAFLRHSCVHVFVIKVPQATELDDAFGVNVFFLQQSVTDVHAPPV